MSPTEELVIEPLPEETQLRRKKRGLGDEEAGSAAPLLVYRRRKDAADCPAHQGGCCVRLGGI